MLRVAAEEHMMTVPTLPVYEEIPMEEMYEDIGENENDRLASENRTVSSKLLVTCGSEEPLDNGTQACAAVPW